MLNNENYKYFKQNLPKDGLRIKIDILWRVFHDSRLDTPGSLDSREVLLELIENLVKQEGYQLPVGKHLYDRAAYPPLPKWIKRPFFGKDKTFAPRKHLWSSELIFLSARSHLHNHEDWLKLDQWFKKTRGIDKHNIPHRERSYEIFRDEKKLDNLRTTKPFKDGQISLEDLACYVVFEPLPIESGPPAALGMPALIVENSTTYWTVANWNKEVGRYSCVIYGSGNKVAAAKDWLVLKREEFEYIEIKYFGDIDATGIEIALRVKDSISDVGGLAFSFELDLYELALQLEEGKQLPKCKGKKTIKKSLRPDFPISIASKIKKIISKGKRIPQEVVTEEVLAELVQVKKA